MLSFHHLAIGAKDPLALADFYKRVFGLEQDVVHRNKDQSVRSVWLKLEAGRLMIENSDELPRVQKAGVDSGWFLLALCTPDLDAARERLKQQKVRIESESKHSLYFRDPEGNRCALSAYPFDA